jgi:uncharacterized protein YndB with AHSA1/START domain
MTELSVHIEKNIKAPIEKVFDAWLDPTLLARFMTPMPGMPDSDVVNEPCESGTFSIIMHVGNEKLPHTGTYLEISRPKRLVFTWGSDRSLDDSRVTLDFTDTGDGHTKVSLSHVKFIDEEARADHEGGWENILDRLTEFIV